MARRDWITFGVLTAISAGCFTASWLLHRAERSAR